MDAGKIVPNFLGPYSPPVKSAAFALKKLTEPTRKTSDARERQEREKNQRIPVEILGNTGFIPLYRDVRKVLLADIYKDLKRKPDKTYTKDELKKLKKTNRAKYYRVIYKQDLKKYERDLKKYNEYSRNVRKWPRKPKRPRQKR